MINMINISKLVIGGVCFIIGLFNILDFNFSLTPSYEVYYFLLGSGLIFLLHFCMNNIDDTKRKSYNIDKTKQEPGFYVVVGYAVFLIIGFVIVIFIPPHSFINIKLIGTDINMPSELLSFIVGVLSPRIPFYKN